MHLCQLDSGVCLPAVCLSVATREWHQLTLLWIHFPLLSAVLNVEFSTPNPFSFFPNKNCSSSKATILLCRRISRRASSRGMQKELLEEKKKKEEEEESARKSQKGPSSLHHSHLQLDLSFPRFAKCSKVSTRGADP